MNIPNYKIDDKVSNLSPFTNYNGTIRAVWTGDVFTVWHWSTPVAVYNQRDNELTVAHWFISQTTSTLLGRVIRNLPNRRAVLNAIDAMPKGDARRFRAMLNR